MKSSHGANSVSKRPWFFPPHCSNLIRNRSVESKHQISAYLAIFLIIRKRSRNPPTCNTAWPTMLITLMSLRILRQDPPAMLPLHFPEAGICQAAAERSTPDINQAKRQGSKPSFSASGSWQEHPKESHTQWSTTPASQRMTAARSSCQAARPPSRRSVPFPQMGKCGRRHAGNATVAGKC
ncbi:hypothetical protein N658DRAFT_80766 [Parathielavia hyrcaniae]|uniref:Uncharacterized protein n=1 Tax=Parathielavia hyrcaniae TaxID=113614 RepID=A0AAN6Q3M7_9PEZI|nr:hypothetical protein N658DRAFT_80766 [Parathielavia hyrcaniae]